MYKLLGFFTQNTMKTLYVLEEIGADYEFQFVDLFNQEHMTEAFQQLTPMGKVPILQHNGENIFESATICRYVANVEESSLYPADKMQRAKVDQWIDFFNCHLGRWLSLLYFENIIKNKAGMGEPDAKVCEEADKFSNQQLAMLDKWLKQHEYLADSGLSIADLYGFALMEQLESIEFDLSAYPHVQQWYVKLGDRESVARGRKKVAR